MNATRLILAAILLLSPTVRTVQAAQTVEPAGFAQVVQKHVSALEDNTFRRMLERLSPVFVADAVETSKESKAQFEFWDGSFLVVGPESRIELAEYVYAPGTNNAGEMLFKLGEGAFRAVTGAITKNAPQAVNLETPLGVIGVRGTDLGVDFRGGALTVAVFEGGPVTFTDAATNSVTEIRAGMQLSLRQGERPNVEAVTARITGELRDNLKLDLDAAADCVGAVLRSAKTKVPDNPLDALQAARGAYAKVGEKAGGDRRGFDGAVVQSMGGALRGSGGLSPGGGLSGGLGSRGGLGGGLGGRGGDGGGRGGGGGGRR